MTKLEKLIRERAYPKGNCIPDEYFMGIDHAASVASEMLNELWSSLYSEAEALSWQGVEELSASEDWARSKGVASAMSVMKKLITEETIADGE